MNATIPYADSRALYSQDGKTWQDGSTVTWPDTSDLGVSKIVIGTPFKAGDDLKTITDLPEIPENLATLYPNLTHLYLWQIGNLHVLPILPTAMKCIDVRACSGLKSITNLPIDLEALILENLPPDLMTLPTLPTEMAHLQELSLRGCAGLLEHEISRLVKQSPSLRFLDLSGTLITSLAGPWPHTLVDIRLNDCTKLRRVPTQWPPQLRRVELRRATEVTSLPALPYEADYVDLAYTRSLRQLPSFVANASDSTGRRGPRTLFLFQTGVSLEPDLYGEKDETNVAERVLADQQASTEGRQADCELRLILLGDGRCGKSSLARCWVEGVDSFRADERSTHGVRLWEKEIHFTPVDSLAADDDQDGKAVLHIWDFAGQDLYHSTHRLFLQSRAIFIICHNHHPDHPGADEESDSRERAAIAREGDDVHRPLQYWLDQVDSLGPIPGMEMRPPVLVVRTKADRWPDEGASANEVLFSGKDGRGLSEVVEWVEKQAAKLLGSWDARSLPISAVAVKNQLRPKIAENQSHYWQIEEDDKIVQSPHPRLTVDEFFSLVTSSCTGDYGEKPSLLLDRFHRSGFLYHDQHFLPNDVILDQRWALQGIYVFSSRQSRFHIREHLFDANGQFTRKQVAELCWKPAGYSEAAIDLFLSFMNSCGMCFELLRSGETNSGQAVYAAPGFFPTRSKAESLFPVINDQSEGQHRYVVEKVTEAQIRSIIARVGSDWSRSMYAWRWGCRFASATTGAVCYLDWPRPENSDQYLHDLSVRFDGPEDRPFYEHLDGMLRQIMPSPLFTRHSGTHPSQYAGYDSRRLRLPSADTELGLSGKPNGATSEISPIPARSNAVGIKVTFSYAGSDEEHGRIGDVPFAVAKMLDDHFKKNRLGTVLSYRLVDDEERLQVFTKNLAKGDLVLLFWSKKYWLSEYCLCEMMWIYLEEPKGRFLDKRILTYVLDGARLSRKGTLKATDWEMEWERKAKERDAAADAATNHDLRRKKKLLKRDRVLHDWCEFVLDEEEFEPFVRAMLDYRLGRPLSTPSNDQEVEAAAREIFELVISVLDSSDQLLTYATHKFHLGQIDDAVCLLQQALAMQPVSNRNILDFLSNLTDIEVPSGLREEALKRLTNEAAE
jgi:hypothetical protein